MSAPTIDLDGLLRRLHLPTVRRLYPELAQRAEQDAVSYPPGRRHAAREIRRQPPRRGPAPQPVHQAARPFGAEPHLEPSKLPDAEGQRLRALRIGDRPRDRGFEQPGPGASLRLIVSVSPVSMG
jgi:hypothetical protein